MHGFPPTQSDVGQSCATAGVVGQLCDSDLFAGTANQPKPPCALIDRISVPRHGLPTRWCLMRPRGFQRFMSLDTLVADVRSSMASTTLMPFATLTVMDIVSTYTMFMETNPGRRGVWHWYFLSQPAPSLSHDRQ